MEVLLGQARLSGGVPKQYMGVSRSIPRIPNKQWIAQLIESAHLPPSGFSLVLMCFTYLFRLLFIYC